VASLCWLPFYLQVQTRQRFDCASTTGSLLDMAAYQSGQMRGSMLPTESHCSDVMMSTQPSHDKSEAGTPHVPKLGGTDADADKVCVCLISAGKSPTDGARYLTCCTPDSIDWALCGICSSPTGL
jgi:hypothetical protein